MIQRCVYTVALGRGDMRWRDVEEHENRSKLKVPLLIKVPLGKGDLGGSLLRSSLLLIQTQQTAIEGLGEVRDSAATEGENHVDQEVHKLKVRQHDFVT
jgi:hypothetical protein